MNICLFLFLYCCFTFFYHRRTTDWSNNNNKKRRLKGLNRPCQLTTSKHTHTHKKKKSKQTTCTTETSHSLCVQKHCRQISNDKFKVFPCPSSQRRPVQELPLCSKDARLEKSKRSASKGRNPSGILLPDKRGVHTVFPSLPHICE